MIPTDARRVDRPTIVIPSFMSDERRALEEAIASRATLVTDDEIPDPRELAGPVILVTGMSPERLRALAAAPGLAWVHSTSSGVEHLPLAELAGRGVLLTNSAGAHAPAMAEHAIGAMIMLAHGTPIWLEGQRSRTWLPLEASPISLLRGKRAGILGYGAVGRQLALALCALGMDVWAIRRTPAFVAAEPIVRLMKPDDLPELLAACDFIVLCASLNASSIHLIGEAEFAAMKPGAMLVNVARGDLVDETALIQALRTGRLRGAALDVTSREPLLPESPLWDAPGLILTPHVSGSSPESWAAVLDFLCQNLRVFLAGSPQRMGNLVHYETVL